MVYCNACKAVDGTHFVRNLIRGLAYRDWICIIADIGEKNLSCPFIHGKENVIVIH